MHDLLCYFIPELNFWGDEFEIDNDPADYKEKIFVRAGKICLTNKRLLFFPNLIEKIFKANAHSFDLNKLEKLEIASIDYKDVLGGGIRRRLRFIYEGKEHYFVINKLEYWKNIICSVRKKEMIVY